MSSITLTVGGMTCASCAARIEKNLNRIDGVDCDGQLRDREGQRRVRREVTPEQLVGDRGGGRLQAHLPDAATSRWTRIRRGDAAATADLISAAADACRWSRWRWFRRCSSVLAVGVVGARGAGGGLGRVAVPSGGVVEPEARHRNHGHADLDGHARCALGGRSTRCSGASGPARHEDAFELTIADGRDRATSISRPPRRVTTFILAGRYFEARAKRRAGAALRALLELGAKDVSVLRDGVEQRIPIDTVVDRRRVRGASGREDRHGRRRGRRHFGGRCVDAHR